MTAAVHVYGLGFFEADFQPMLCRKRGPAAGDRLSRMFGPFGVGLWDLEPRVSPGLFRVGSPFGNGFVWWRGGVAPAGAVLFVVCCSGGCGDWPLTRPSPYLRLPLYSPSGRGGRGGRCGHMAIVEILVEDDQVQNRDDAAAGADSGSIEIADEG